MASSVSEQNMSQCGNFGPSTERREFSSIDGKCDLTAEGNCRKRYITCRNSKTLVLTLALTDLPKTTQV
ncbi:hypothetical protein Q5P01_012295 [Channa striata]|uniref:Uncharacterized protein n=1 Tax=Channa striata TaxID=64152 RepID=A0AA88SSV4_CHASR|nr:hypothetical protein Q5P01_012295 [Channa striata]